VLTSRILLSMKKCLIGLSLFVRILVATIVVLSFRIYVSVGRPASQSLFSVLHITETLSAIFTPLCCTGSIVLSADFNADPYTVLPYLSVDKTIIWCNLSSVFSSLPHYLWARVFRRFSFLLLRAFTVFRCSFQFNFLSKIIHNILWCRTIFNMHSPIHIFRVGRD
jgi:hypothetical protein